jgi:pimeloyl-ACP methyl ester carboxylesterase
LKYTNNQSKFIEIEGMQVHYRDEGNALDSVPIVLIHGTSSSLHTWDACTEVWTKKHRVVRLDLPAFGLTGPNTDNDYSIKRYAAFVNDFLGELGIKRCYIAGNSLGGYITWTYTLQHPDNVKKMILIDAGGYAFDFSKSGTLAFKLGKTPVLKNLLTILMSRSVVEKSLKTAYFDESKVSDVLVNRYMDLALREGNRKAFVARMNQPFMGNSEDIKNIKTPTLIIWGDHDRLIPLDCAYKFHKDLPNNKLVVLKNEGHVAMEESPERIIPLVEDFLR